MTTDELRKEFERIKGGNYSPGYAEGQLELLRIEMELKKMETLTKIEDHLKTLASY